jgi:hypothetical protein
VATPHEEEKIEVTIEDREVARAALVERMARKHPERPAPRWFDAGDVAMVAACAAALEGGADEKLIGLRDAISGAFLVSKDGAPTVRFIWEKLDHFLDHVERGRRRRLAQERAAQRAAAARERRPQPPEEAVGIPEEARAELERLFGPGWSAKHARS